MEDKRITYAMYRRWAYMIIAIISAAILLNRPVFSFQEDKGIMYVRSFSMDQRTFWVMQTDLNNGIQNVTGSMSVVGLRYCNLLMLYGTILCFLCFFSDTWRMRITVVIALIAGAYYVLMVFYAMRIADLHYATFTPNLWTLLPAVALEMMLLVRRNIISTAAYRDEMPVEK